MPPPQFRANWKPKTIWTGDNLFIMRGMNSASVDLIYLDPPFNSKANYAAPIGSQAAGAAFKDTWTLSDLDVEWLDLIESRHPALHRVIMATMVDSDKSYLVYMAARLLEMRRILKDTGSIYLHCDTTMSHYLKLVMDAIWGKSSFRNDITWQRNPGHADSSGFGRVADQILFYGGAINRENVLEPIPSETVRQHYRHSDERGKYRPENLKTTGLAGGGYHYDFHGHNGPWRYPHHRMLELESQGRVHLPKKTGGVPQRKRYLHEHKGIVPNSIWTDIKKARGREHTGYPTQKPPVFLGR